MFDIITFGSATWDVFLGPKKIQVLKNKKFITGKGFCFNLGSKVEVDEIYFSSGGGGTNTAATFARQGFKVAYCGVTGEDILGAEIIGELKKSEVDTRFVLKKKAKPTNISVILSFSSQDRTILVYRGASDLLEEKDIPWLRDSPLSVGTVPVAKWFYIASLSGKLAKITEKIIDFAKKNKIKIALNPGNSQLYLENIKDILKKVDILILNQEEASLLTKIPYQKEDKIFQKLDEICPGIAIITKGAKGVVVSDGKYIYQAGILKVKVVDGTGAGDSFGSGFVSGFIQEKGNIEQGIQLGVANAAFCLQKYGAKNGLLKKGEKFKKVKVFKKCLK